MRTPRRSATCFGKVLLFGSLVVAQFFAAPGSVRAQWDETKVGQILEDVNSLLGRTQALPNKLTELNNLPSMVLNQLGFNLDPTVRARIVEVFQEALQALADERESLLDLEGFLGGPGGGGGEGTPCFEFRQELLGLATGSGDLLRALLAIHPSTDLDADLISLSLVIQALPCALLFPLHQLFGNLSHIQEWLPELIDGSQEIADLYDVDLGCATISERQDEITAASTTMTIGSVVFKVIGAKLHSDNALAKGPLASRVLVGDKIIGVHGYASLRIERPKHQNRLSNLFNSLSELLKGAADFGMLRVRHCELVRGHEQVLFAVASSSSALLQALNSTEARLGNEVRNGMALLTDVIQTEARAHQESFDRWSELALQLEIEDALNRNDGKVATFQLPRSAGGLLELVRDVVQMTITQMQQAGLGVHNAEKEWQKGNRALAAAQFKEAFESYSKAYREATKR